MSLININGKLESICDDPKFKQNDITDLIRQYMGDDMAEYIEQTMKEKDEECENLLEELKSAGSDINKIKKKADTMHRLNGIIDFEEVKETIDNIYENIFNKLFDEYGIQI